MIKALKSRLRRGFNLIEAAVVLGVIGLVIGGIWTAAAKISFDHRWQQTEVGWIYYLDNIMRNFNKVNVAGTANYEDIDGYLAVLPLPAGWSVNASGKRVDPMGTEVLAQIQWQSGVSFGPYLSSSDPLLCKKYGLFIATRLDRLYGRISGGPAPTCNVTNFDDCCGSLASNWNNTNAARFELPPN